MHACLWVWLPLVEVINLLLCMDVPLTGPNTLQCSVENLELFSCSLRNEDETALSILEPVFVSIEMKPLDKPEVVKGKGTHLLEVGVVGFLVTLSILFPTDPSVLHSTTECQALIQ